jgi:hypothetical protein
MGKKCELLAYTHFTVQQAIFPLSCAGAEPLSNRNAPAQTELLLRSCSLCIFIVNILIMHITKKTFKVSRSCKNS